jgi:hypothetical protein
MFESGHLCCTLWVQCLIWQHNLTKSLDLATCTRRIYKCAHVIVWLLYLILCPSRMSHNNATKHYGHITELGADDYEIASCWTFNICTVSTINSPLHTWTQQLVHNSVLRITVRPNNYLKMLCNNVITHLGHNYTICYAIGLRGTNEVAQSLIQWGMEKMFSSARSQNYVFIYS